MPGTVNQNNHRLFNHFAPRWMSMSRSLTSLCATQHARVQTDLCYARPVRISFQYRASRPRRLRYHMSRRSWVVSINGIEGVGFIV